MVANRTVFIGDNLPVLRGLDDASIDLVYADPPFNSNRLYEAPIGSKAAGAAFKDTWTRSDLDDCWIGEIADRNPAVYAVCQAALHAHSSSMFSYLCMLTPRVLEIARILKPSGSVYIHVDMNADSYVRLLLDAIFGAKNMRNEIIWCYPPTGMPPKRGFPRKHDTILFYSGSDSVFNTQYGPMGEATLRSYSSIDKDGRRYSKAHGGRTYLDESKGRQVPSWWTDIGSGSTMPRSERVGYPTQKPLALLRRIVLASSNPGDRVLDPFCGCATAPLAAEIEGREWVGIDLSELAGKLVKQRFDQHNGIMAPAASVTIRTDIPRRSDAAALPSYRTHKHTLFGSQEGQCAGCRHSFPYRNFQIDHIIPRSRGGDDRLENLQLLCAACNSQKGARSMAYLQAQLRKDHSLLTKEG